jgi:hypothetical protein
MARYATCHLRTTLLWLGTTPWLLGCAGYFVGAPTLYRPDIYTIHVPIVESDSYRRFLGERLTEAIVKQIELKTPYKVVADPFADSVLQCRIVQDSKYVIAENRNDEPRDIEYQMFAEVTWRDRSGQVILGPEFCVVPGGLLNTGQSVHFVPEAGQSLSTGQLDSIDRLAEQIVSHMEIPW